MSDTTDILRALSKITGATIGDLSDETGLTFDEVHAAIYNLKKRGKIKVVPLTYVITADGMEALITRRPEKSEFADHGTTTSRPGRRRRFFRRQTIR